MKFFFVLLASLFSLYGFIAQAADIQAPEVTTSERRSLPNPDDRIGSYNQPRWTQNRSFTASRVYVIPENSLEVEMWMVQKVDRETKNVEMLLQKEVEFGLGHGFQIDIYQNDIKDKDSREWQYEGMQFELRYALADWGKILLNPTLYFEYHTRDVDPDKFEFRLLLADDFFPGWRFTSNLAYETELWGDQKVQEYAFTAGAARKICTPVMFGAEVKFEGSDTLDTRGSQVWEYYVGPSLRWTPTARSNLLVTSLIGLNRDSHVTESMMIFGIEL